MSARNAPTCVFCGQRIGPDQESSGRAPMAAHATCADAALADDAHWNAIDAGSGSAEEEPRSGGAARSGCLTLGLPILAATAALLIF